MRTVNRLASNARSATAPGGVRNASDRVDPRRSRDSFLQRARRKSVSSVSTRVVWVWVLLFLDALRGRRDGPTKALGRLYNRLPVVLAAARCLPTCPVFRADGCYAVATPGTAPCRRKTKGKRELGWREEFFNGRRRPGTRVLLFQRAKNNTQASRRTRKLGRDIITGGKIDFGRRPDSKLNPISPPTLLPRSTFSWSFDLARPTYISRINYSQRD